MPLALGYLRHHQTDPPEVAAALTTELHAYAKREGLTLADVYTDLFDSPASQSSRSAFCALMDALRRHDACSVIIASPEHLSRQPRSYVARRTIIETESGCPTPCHSPQEPLVSHPADTRPLIYDDLMATTLPHSGPPSRPPIATGQVPCQAPPGPRRSETPLFDSLMAEWNSPKPTLATTR